MLLCAICHKLTNLTVNLMCILVFSPILIQCFLSYISPMEWRYVIVALVPERLLEFLDAPLPTVFGIHSSLLNSEEVQRVRASSISVFN